MKRIWGIKINQQSQVPGAQQVDLPELVYMPSATDSVNTSPRGIAAAATAQASTTSFLDVVNNFYWTYSKPESREEVPTIFLKEKKLLTNALISQLKYSLGAASSSAQAAAQTIGSTVVNAANGTVFSDVAGFTQDKLNGAANLVTGLTNLANQGLAAAGIVSNDPTVDGSKWLAPYQGLYATKPTGWQFLFPYFDDTYEAHANAFSSEGSVGGLGGLIGEAANLAYSFSEVAGFLSNPKQITYIERAKFYNFPTEGENITFSFPLINTGSVDYDDVVSNWQLLFLLLYNNKPGRISTTTVEQPVIYEVEIPGVKFYPYCYITSIDIKFQGSRREMSMVIPYTSPNLDSNAENDVTNVSSATSTKSINTIVPDAYFVTITLKSMLAETKNFMYHLIDKGERTRASSR
jgi:hypothetical protein